MPKQISDEVRTALAAADIDNCRLVLPQLDRAQYKQVDAVLRNLGGFWSRYEKSHVFPDDPTEKIHQVLATGQAPGPARTDEGFVATPPELAQRIVREFTDLGDRDQRIEGVPYVLEPSAGEGALTTAIREADPPADILALEPNTERAGRIPRDGTVVRTVRLEDYLHSPEVRTFDVIVANPPFTLPGRPTAWIEHTWHSWSLLAPGGRMVSVAPRGLAFREDRKHREIRSWLERYGGGWHELDEDAFAESGTTVRAVVFWVDKPADWTSDDDRPAKRRGKPSPEQQAEARAEDQELTTAIRTALADPEYAASVADRVNATPIDCRLRSYSAFNQAAVLAQADAHGVAVTGHLNTFRGWAEQGRMVCRGQKGLRIVAAMGDEQSAEAEQDPDAEPPRKRFRMTTRFDLSQTRSIDDEEEAQ